MTARVLTMPGINNSGPTHWQSLWEKADPTIRRIQVGDWDYPVCESWIHAINETVKSSGPEIILVAHSLGCLPVVEWALRSNVDGIRGALLVSVPDPKGPNFPQEAKGFNMPRLERLRFESIVVSSENDPYGTQAYHRRCADAWGSKFINIGAAGHINANSNLGEWHDGLKMLELLRKH